MIAVGIAALAVVAILVVFSLVGRRSSRLPSRPTLAIVAFHDETNDERLRQVRIGKIISDAVVQKFYEFPHVQLVSPLRIARVKKELDISDELLARDPSLVETIARETEGQLLISGTLNKLGDGIILSANLNDLGQERLLASFRQEDSEEHILGALIDSLCARFQQRIVDAFQISESTPERIAGIGELTTTSLEAYAHFVKGFELYQSGVFHPGIEEMIRATEIDSNFALAYSLIACAYSFAKEDEASNRYFNMALKFRDRFKGIGKEALIFRGNVGWFENDLEACGKNYRLITELYPDDREGYHYYGLYFAHLRNDHQSALEQYEKAIALSPDWYPTYRDMAYSLVSLQSTDVAIEFLQDYIRAYSGGPGADYARQTIAELRGVE